MLSSPLDQHWPTLGSACAVSILDRL